MEKTKVFIAYSRTDEPFLHRLREYLAPLERNQAIEVWYDGKIAAGQQWDKKIKIHLHAADLILLLVSAKSLASNYFYNEEMKDALARHEREEAIVVPVILKHCGWQMTDLKDLQALPKDAKPISAWNDESAAYNSVLEGIYQNVQTIQERKEEEQRAIEQAEKKRKEAEERKLKEEERWRKLLLKREQAQATREARKEKEAEEEKRREKEIRQQRERERIEEKERKTQELERQEQIDIYNKLPNKNVTKSLKVALPILIGITAIFGIFTWVNKPLPEPIQDLINDMVFVEGGEFEMGCTSEQYDCHDDETNVHTVILDDFAIGKYEVTQDQWEAVMGSNPSHFKDCGSRCPVENVSWNEAQKFIKKLKQMTGKTFRLPTEAEWEYAARGRSTKGYIYAGSDDIGSVAWYSSNSNETHTVGTKNPNELGLYDMSGNVYEWCNDWYDQNYYKNSPRNNPQGPSTAETYRVVRGGGWDNSPYFCRVLVRNKNQPGYSLNCIGFRLAQTP